MLTPTLLMIADQQFIFIVKMGIFTSKVKKGHRAVKHYSLVSMILELVKLHLF